MEAVTTPTLGPGHTRDDLDRMPEDGNRYELLEGEIVMSPSPRYVHQRISSQLHVLLAASCPEEWIVLSAPFDVELAIDTVVEPDLLVVERDRPEERGLTGPPLLVVEILSPSTRGRDLVRKKRIYEKAGVPSYWVVDPDGPGLTAWELHDGRYHTAVAVTGDEEWTAATPFPVTLSPAQLAR